jgi:hypothetical protein
MEADYQAMLKGVAAGIAVTAILGGVLYFTNVLKAPSN